MTALEVARWNRQPERLNMTHMAAANVVIAVRETPTGAGRWYRNVSLQAGQARCGSAMRINLRWTNRGTRIRSREIHKSTRQGEKTMSFVSWIALGLTAGIISSGLAKRSGESILPDILLGVIGATAAGWSFYTFGPPSVNGFHFFSLVAAAGGSLVFLLTYYALRLL
jgi:uncharacterized membrane protein YeaQ/YmgE (transglycosylase-associated protein family)